MTMVTFTDSQRIPVLIADSLISGPGDESALTTPDHPRGISAVFPPQSGFVPKYLARKTSLINSNLAIAMSGSVVHMRAFRKDLNASFPRFLLIANQRMWQIFFSNTGTTHTVRSCWSTSRHYYCQPTGLRKTCMSTIFLVPTQT